MVIKGGKTPNYKIQILVIQIFISFNPIKWIYFKSNLYF